jgi:hypothetical protein
MVRKLLFRYFALIVLGFSLVACSKTFERREPVGQSFPRVKATGLTGEEVTIPDLFRDNLVVLFVGYVQDAQFDVDRWLLGLKQLETPVEVAEIPTIQGFVPGLFASRIDQGMRNGIPEEEWKIVFTVYKDASEIARFFGNEKPRNVRVALLDQAGKVLWFHDRGFSADRAIELDKLIRELKGQPRN